ncbi:transposase [Phaeobacter sp. JH204B]
MMAEAMTLPEDYGELKEFTTQLLAEIKAQAMLIEKLRHQVAGQKAWRYGSTSEQTKQLMLALEASEVAEAAMTAKMKPPQMSPRTNQSAVRSRTTSHATTSNSCRQKITAHAAVHCARSART